MALTSTSSKKPTKPLHIPLAECEEIGETEWTWTLLDEIFTQYNFEAKTGVDWHWHHVATIRRINMGVMRFHEIMSKQSSLWKVVMDTVIECSGRQSSTSERYRKMTTVEPFYYYPPIQDLLRTCPTCLTASAAIPPEKMIWLLLDSLVLLSRVPELIKMHIQKEQKDIVGDANEIKNILKARASERILANTSAPNAKLLPMINLALATLHRAHLLLFNDSLSKETAKEKPVSVDYMDMSF